MADEPLSNSRVEYLLEAILRLKLGASLERIITDPTEIKVYEMTGVSNRSGIETSTKLSAGSISNLWAKWERLGLIIKDGKGFKKLL